MKENFKCEVSEVMSL